MQEQRPQRPVEQEQRQPRERALDLLRLLVPDWRPTAVQILWAIRIAVAVAIVLGVLALIGYSFGITLWDWLRVLAVPITIGAAVPLLNWLQKRRELDVESQRAQDEALQMYLGQMGQLLLDKDKPLRRSHLGDVANTLARARTIAVLGTLDANHNRIILSFLEEMQLGSVITLARADLSQVDLEKVTLSAGDLTDAILYKANMEEAILCGNRLTLIGANLTGANLRKAEIFGHVNLGCSILKGADLREAKLVNGINLSYALLEGADLRDAFLGGQDSGELRYYMTPKASGAMFIPSTFEDTNLDGANFKGVNLHRAEITAEQLAQCRSLEGATMPNGQKFEDWLETPEGQDWFRNFGAHKKEFGH